MLAAMGNRKTMLQETKKQKILNTHPDIQLDYLIELLLENDSIESEIIHINDQKYQICSVSNYKKQQLHDSAQIVIDCEVNNNIITATIMPELNTKIIVGMKNLDNIQKEKRQHFPEIIEGKAFYKNKWRKVDYIQVFECPRAYIRSSIVKCEHMVCLYFKDGTRSDSNSFKLELSDIREFGYTPYIYQYRANEDDIYQNQLELCEVSKLIGAERIYKFDWC
jgi:hypothetical protein